MPDPPRTTTRRSLFDRIREFELTSKQFGMIVAALAVPVVLACWWISPLHLTGEGLFRYVAIFFLLFFVSCFPVRVSSEHIALSTLLPVAMATTYLYGPFGAVFVSMAAMLASVSYMQEKFPKSRLEWRRFGWGCLHNIPMIAVSVGLPGLLYTGLLRLQLFSQHSIYAAASLSLASIGEFYINAAMLTTLAALWSKTRWDVVWYNNYRWTMASAVLLSPLGYLMGALTEQSLIYGLIFILVPLIAVHKGYELHVRQIKTYKQGIELLGRLMQESHPYTHGHLNRVARWAVKIAESLNLPAESMAHVEHAAILHDIGKIAVDDRILNKPGKLDDEEWEKIKEHPAIGEEIASKMKYLHQVSVWIRHHHERIDGKGYPDGLSGDDIPIESKIICVVDAFDAMVGGPAKSDQRTYREPKTMEEGRAELMRCAGTQFDELVVTSFLQVLDREEMETKAAIPDIKPHLTLVSKSNMATAAATIGLASGARSNDGEQTQSAAPSSGEDSENKAVAMKNAA